MALCCKLRKGDLSRCIPLYVVGALLLLVGIPMMVVGIVASFTYSDFIGYAGGISSFFGVLFLCIWYMATIPNLEKMRIKSEDANSTKSTKNILAKGENPNSYANFAYEKETRGHPVSSHARHGSASSCNSDSINEFIGMPTQSNNSNNVAASKEVSLDQRKKDLIAPISSISGTRISHQVIASST